MGNESNTNDSFTAFEAFDTPLEENKDIMSLSLSSCPQNSDGSNTSEGNFFFFLI